MNDALTAAINANVPAEDRSRIIEDADVDPVSVRNGVVRVGEGEYQDGSTWYYRGYALTWNCGRYATKFKSSVGDFNTIAAWKKAVDARLAR